MKLRWEPGPGGLVAQTPFCELAVFQQQGRRARHAGRVEGRSGLLLVSVDDLASQEAAQTWCEERYWLLLKFEIDHLEAQP